LKQHSLTLEARVRVGDQQAKIHRLKAELRRITDERDILKKATAYLCHQGDLPRNPCEAQLIN